MNSLDPQHITELQEIANRVRARVLVAVHHAGGGHVGGPLSCSDMLVALYFHLLRIDPARPEWEDRDRFILSKGHSAIALYATLAERGYFPVEELLTFDAIDSRLQGHPDMTKIPGVDMSSGSLGQGLSPGLGMALGARLLGKDFHTYVMLGDGESQEGQVWIVVAQPGLHVIITGAYSGIQTGKTGKTHQSVQDLSIFRAMPNMTVVAPMDAVEVRQALHVLVKEHHGPAYLRLTRDPFPVYFDGTYQFKLGKAVVLRQGGDVALIGTGEQSARCLQAAELLAAQGLQVYVLHVPTLKPLDADAILEAARQTGRVVTAEDHTIIGGLGSAVAEVLGEYLPTPMRRVGWADVYGESAPNEPLLEKYGLTPRHIAATAQALLATARRA